MRKHFEQSALVQSSKPSRLDILRELSKREALNEEMTEELKILEDTNSSLHFILENIKEHGAGDWITLRDVFIGFELPNIDLLLLTSAGTYIFRIERDDDEYYPENDPFFILEKTHEALHEYFNRINTDLNLQNSIIFSKPELNIDFYEEVDDVHIVSSNNLKNYILEILETEQNNSEAPMDIHENAHWIGYFNDRYPQKPTPIKDEIKKKVRPGVLCNNCGNFDLKFTDSYISCSCSAYQSIENAIIRTVKEWAIINPEEPLAVSTLLEFIDEKITKEELNEYMIKHFSPAVYDRE